MLKLTPPRCRAQRGLTLVELMVALTIGMFLTAALMLLFANSALHGKELDRAGVQIENGRFATEMLRDEIALAGFYGAVPRASVTKTTPALCGTDPSTGWSNTAPLSFPAPVVGVQSSTTTACTTNRRSGTEALVVRRVAVDATNIASLAAGGQQFYLQDSFCSTDVLPFAFAKASASLGLKARDCAAVNSARAWVERIYFVASCNRCGAGGDSSPTLKRAELVGNAWEVTALVDGVESMRFDFGVDTTGDGQPDSFVDAASVTDWGQVMAVKAHLLTRSLDKTATLQQSETAQSFKLGGVVVNTTADGYLRRAYSQTVRIVNPSAALE